MGGSARKIWTKVLVFYDVLVVKMANLLGNILKISYFKIVKHKLSLYLVLSCQDSKHLMFWDILCMKQDQLFYCSLILKLYYS